MAGTALQRDSAMRWMVSGLLLAFSACLVWGVRHAPYADFQALLSLVVLLTAFSIYLWLLDSLVWSASLSALVFLQLCWVWAVGRLPLFGWLVGVFLILTALVFVARSRRATALLHLKQGLEDLQVALTEKAQSLDDAQKARDAAEKKKARYERLQSIAESLSHLTDVQSIARLAVDRAFELVGKSDACCLLLLDESQQELSLVASRKRDPALVVRAKHGDSFDRLLLKTQKPLLVNDIRRDFRFTTSLSHDRPMTAIVGCPLILSGRPEGVLRLDSAQAAVYTQDDLRLLDILLDLVGTALTNARLFHQLQQLAVTDSLTGLSLRRPFMEQFGREILRAVRSREALSVLMLDVDYFKRYNDTYGHLAGDAVLRSIAQLLRQALPAESLIARYGGEEFAVVLPRAAVSQAAELANQVRLLVEQDANRIGAGHRKTEPLPVTVSIGVSSFPADAQSEVELIRIADQRLYQAKHLGRNRVCAK